MIELKWKTSEEIACDIALRMQKKRKLSHITQKELADRSGVSYGSLKRFEETGEISLTSLIKLAMVLRCERDFDDLFSREKYRSIEEIVEENANAKRR